MSGETNLEILLQSMEPSLNPGEYVFCTVENMGIINPSNLIGTFNEKEGTNVIIPREKADQARLSYSFVAAWITLTVHSSLEALGLTAAFSVAHAKEGISCNVVSGFYHDHIFVNLKYSEKAIGILKAFFKKMVAPKCRSSITNMNLNNICSHYPAISIIFSSYHNH